LHAAVGADDADDLLGGRIGRRSWFEISHDQCAAGTGSQLGKVELRSGGPADHPLGPSKSPIATAVVTGKEFVSHRAGVLVVALIMPKLSGTSKRNVLLDINSGKPITKMASYFDTSDGYRSGGHAIVNDRVVVFVAYEP